MTLKTNWLTEAYYNPDDTNLDITSRPSFDAANNEEWIEVAINEVSAWYALTEQAAKQMAYELTGVYTGSSIEVPQNKFRKCTLDTGIGIDSPFGYSKTHSYNASKSVRQIDGYQVTRSVETIIRIKVTGSYAPVTYSPVSGYQTYPRNVTLTAPNQTNVTGLYWASLPLYTEFRHSGYNQAFVATGKGGSTTVQLLEPGALISWAYSNVNGAGRWGQCSMNIYTGDAIDT